MRDIAPGEMTFGNIVWQARVGQGFSGMIVSKDRVFTQGQNTAGQFVLCLDAATGECLWRYRYGRPWDVEGNYAGPYASPVFYHGKVYYCGCYGVVGCLDALTGKSLWRVNLVEELGVRVPGFGYAITPLLHDGRMLIAGGANGPSMIAFNAVTGNVLWSMGTDSASYSSPVLVPSETGDMVTCFLENTIVLHRIDDGEQIWRYEWSEGYDPHAAWPLRDGRHLVFSAPFRRGAVGFLVEEDDGRTKCRKLWDTKDLCLDVLCAAVHNGRVYGFSVKSPQARVNGGTPGVLRAIDVRTGEMQWEHDGISHCSVMLLGQKLVLWSEDGWLTLGRDEGDCFAVEFRQKLLDERLCWTSPAYDRGTLFVRGGDTIVALSLSACEGPENPIHVALADSGWFGRIVQSCRGSVVWSPSFVDMLSWFVFCLALCVFALCVVALLPCVPLCEVSILITMFIFGILGMVPLSLMMGRIVFSWPVSLYAMLSLLCLIQRWDGDTNVLARRSICRLILFLFVLLCAVYWKVIHALLLEPCVGFLFGLLPSVIVLCVLDRYIGSKSSRLISFGVNVLGFAVLFWSSVLVILIRS
ncbi:MAG: PQQ-binding-like beta-propeller repeat protein [Kiritimatiellae bacterium]|nr:PQQ-binding-like beta-propeller repeat protein [Kiritimatiellia bacterium]